MRSSGLAVISRSGYQIRVERDFDSTVWHTKLCRLMADPSDRNRFPTKRGGTASITSITLLSIFLLRRVFFAR